MYGLRNKGFVSCSDFVGHSNGLSNILTFLLSYTELITLTDHFAAIQPPTKAKYIFFLGGLLLFLPVYINVKWKIGKLLLSKVMSSQSVTH